MSQRVEMNETQRRFFDDFMDTIQVLTRDHPKITNMEFISIMSRCVGMAIKACASNEQATMRQLAIENIDTGFKRDQK